MLNSNVEFFKKTSETAMDANNTSFILDLFAGTAPTEAFIEGSEFLKSSRYDMVSIYGALSEEQSMLATISFESNIKAEYEGSNTVVLPFSDSTREMAVLAEGSATWFMLYRSTASFAGENHIDNTDLLATMIMIGSVGDLGSGSDIEIPNSAIALDRAFKCNDIKFNLV